MSYIYKITNKVNGMSYIGNTSYDVQKRWKEHRKDSRSKRCSNRPLYSAINEYGPENFDIDIIEQCDKDIASFREKYWIEKYNTYLDGYNDTLGGSGKQQIDHDLLINTYRKTRSQKKTAEALNICESSVQKILNKEHVEKFPKEDTYRDYMKPVEVYTVNGQFVKSFPSVSSAAKWLHEQGKTKSWASAEVNIRKNVNKPGVCFGGYIWKRPKYSTTESR